MWGLIILIGYIALRFRIVRKFVEKYWQWIIMILIAYFLGKAIAKHQFLKGGALLGIT